jgi:hypothetical protein
MTCPGMAWWKGHVRAPSTCIKVLMQVFIEYCGRSSSMGGSPGTIRWPKLCLPRRAHAVLLITWQHPLEMFGSPATVIRPNGIGLRITHCHRPPRRPRACLPCERHACSHKCRQAYAPAASRYLLRTSHPPTATSAAASDPRPSAACTEGFRLGADAVPLMLGVVRRSSVKRVSAPSRPDRAPAAG